MISLRVVDADFHSDITPHPVWSYACSIAPTLRNLRAITFEFHESCFENIGVEGIIRELEKIQMLADAVEAASPVCEFMLADFQRALADMAASPQLCQVVRRKPDTLWQRYSLSAMEHRRIVEMVNSPGMSQDCALYRANRFAPIALNLPEVCRALGAELRGMVDEYWKAYPSADSNSLLECDRFCRFLRAKKMNGWTMRRNVRQAFQREQKELRVAPCDQHHRGVKCSYELQFPLVNGWLSQTAVWRQVAQIDHDLPDLVVTQRSFDAGIPDGKIPLSMTDFSCASV